MKNLSIQAIKLFIHSFNKDVLNACCVSGTVQGVGRKTEMKTALSSKKQISIFEGERDLNVNKSNKRAVCVNDESRERE